MTTTTLKETIRNDVRGSLNPEQVHLDEGVKDKIMDLLKRLKSEPALYIFKNQNDKDQMIIYAQANGQYAYTKFKDKRTLTEEKEISKTQFNNGIKKLKDSSEWYLEETRSWIKQAGINTITMMMEIAVGTIVLNLALGAFFASTWWGIPIETSVAMQRLIMRIEEIIEEQFDKNAYYKTFEGRIKKMYETARTRTNQRGYKGTFISLDDFLDFARNDKTYKKLYKQWEKSGFDPRLTPTLDRISHKKGYVKGNLQFLTFSSNVSKGNYEYEKNPSVYKQHKVKLTNGDKVKEFDSMAEAARFLGVKTSSVTRAAQQKRSVRGWQAEAN